MWRMRDGRQFFRGTFDIKFDENFHFGANYYFDRKVYVNICLIELEIYYFSSRKLMGKLAVEIIAFLIEFFPEVMMNFSRD